MPLIDGSTTDNTNAAATAASIAFPPFDKISTPALAAKGCAADTTPLFDRIIFCDDSGYIPLDCCRFNPQPTNSRTKQ